MDKSIRQRINFFPQERLSMAHRGKPWDLGIKNIIYETEKDDEKWISETTKKIGDWRSISYSTYMRWAVSINGLYHSAEDYESWIPERGFKIDSIRYSRGGVKKVPLVIWTGQQAAEAHRESAKLLPAYGASDQYGCLEEIIFAAYGIYLQYNPGHLLEGDQYKELRRIYRNRNAGQDEASTWNAAWSERLNSWLRKKAYSGLHTIFKAYMDQAGLKRPSWYQNTTIETWAESIKGISELRNLVVHGATRVSPELAEISGKPWGMTFDFVSGDPLEVKLHHLQSIECFTDQLLTALNASLLEKIHGPSPDLMAMLGQIMKYCAN